MRGINDFIVIIPKKYLETFNTESGVKLYGDQRWSMKEMANTVVEVHNVPFGYDGPIKPGYQLFIDSTVVLQFNSPKEGVLESHYMVDREKSLFKVNWSLLIMYRENPESDWKCFEDNVVSKQIELKTEETVTASGLIIPAITKPKVDKKKVTVAFDNEMLLEDGIAIGKNIFIDDYVAIEVFLESKSYQWSKYKHVLGMELKHTA